MIIVSYDISDDKLRTKFSKYLEKYGHRLQFSMFEIENSKKVLNNIITNIKNNFEKRFTNADSVIIFELSSSCNVTRFGYAVNEVENLIII